VRAGAAKAAANLVLNAINHQKKLHPAQTQLVRSFFVPVNMVRTS